MLRLSIFLSCFLYFVLITKAQINLDIIYSSSSNLGLGSFATNYQGDFIVVGNSGPSYGVHKVSSSGQLEWSNTYFRQHYDHQPTPKTVTVDSVGNIYLKLETNEEDHWLEKLNPSGILLSRSIDIGGEETMTYSTNGILKIVKDTLVVVGSEELSRYPIIYKFDTSLSSLYSNDTIALEYQVSGIGNGKVYDDYPRFILQGSNNGVDGYYTFGSNANFNTFDSFNFTGGIYWAFGTTDNKTYFHSNNVENNSNADTGYTTRPQAILINEYGVVLQSVYFADAITDTATTLTRVLIRELKRTENYGIIAIGNTNEGFNNNLKRRSVVFQLDPNTLELKNYYVGDTESFMFRLATFGEKVYALEKLVGNTSSGYNIVELGLPVISSSPTIYNESNQVIAYPNPVGDLLKLKNGEDAVGKVFYITDLAGRVVSIGTFQGEINTSDLGEGMYLLSIEGYKTTKFQKIK